MSAVPAYTRAAERAPERYPERPPHLCRSWWQAPCRDAFPGDRRARPSGGGSPCGACARGLRPHRAYCRRRQCRNRVEELRHSYRHRAPEGSSLEVAQSSLPIPPASSPRRPPLAWLRPSRPAKSFCPKTSSRPTARAISRFPRVWPPPRGASGRIWPTADATCATGIIPTGAKRGGRILLAARGDRPAPARRAGVPPVRVSARIAGPPHHALHVHRARRAVAVSS